MKNEITIFNYNSNEVRTVIIDGEPWFILKDVCTVLGIQNNRNVPKRLDDDEKAEVDLVDVSSNGVAQTRKFKVTNESGLYNVIMQSEKAEAKAFRRWITHEVIPSIRKHGGYITKEKIAELIYNPDTMIHWLTELKKTQEKNSELHNEISVLKPKADYHDLILQSKSAIIVF